MPSRGVAQVSMLDGGWAPLTGPEADAWESPRLGWALGGETGEAYCRQDAANTSGVLHWQN